jgi:rhodanese-related sulfurtransferase
MPSSVREMLAEANAAVPRLNPAEVREMIGRGNVLIVDVRDAPELASGGKLKARSTCHAVCSNSGPIRRARTTIQLSRRTRLPLCIALLAAAPR